MNEGIAVAEYYSGMGNPKFKIERNPIRCAHCRKEVKLIHGAVKPETFPIEVRMGDGKFSGVLCEECMKEFQELFVEFFFAEGEV